MEQTSAAVELADSLAAPEPTRRRWIGISTVFVGLMVLGVLFLVIVPGRQRHFFSQLDRIAHGWPLVFVERQVIPWTRPIDSWRLGHRVVFWSPLALAADVLCAAAISGAVMFVYERWRRRPRRFAVSLRFALVVIAVLSVSMFFGSHWVTRQRAFVELARSRGWNLAFAGPDWIDKLLRDPGKALPRDFYPDLLLSGDHTPIRMSVPYGARNSDLRKPDLQLMDRAAEHVTLELTINELDESLSGALAGYQNCRHLRLTLGENDSPLVRSFLADLSNLESVSLRVNGTSRRLPNRPLIAETLECFVNPARIQAISLRTSRLASDEELAPLEKFTGLEHLELYGVQPQAFVTDGLKRLTSLPRLRSLELSAGNRSNSPQNMSESLAALTELRLLAIENVTLEVRDIELVNRLPKLKYLDLRNCGLSKSAFELLGSMQHLNGLDATSSTVDRNPMSQAQVDQLETQLPGRLYRPPTPGSTRGSGFF